MTFDPSLWGPVAQTTADARLLFEWLRNTIFDQRHALYRDAFQYVSRDLRPDDRFLVDNLGSYNRAAALFNLPKLKPMLLVWDEANSHLRDKPLQAIVEKTLQASRKVGCDIVVAGHNWRATDIPAGLKLQLENQVIMKCSEQDSHLLLDDPSLASRIPAGSPGMAYIKLVQWQGYFQAYHLPDNRLITMVNQSRPRIEQTWSSLTQPSSDHPALPEMDMDELFALNDGEDGEDQSSRQVKMNSNDPALRQRVIELLRSKNDKGKPYSQSEIERIISFEFSGESYRGGQAFKVVRAVLDTLPSD